MIRIFGTAIFFSAALLFLIQPMAAKLVLPILGGSPSVWNTAMLFFQTVLILGYLYAHLLTRKLPLAAQFVVHGVVLACVVLTLPIGLPSVLYSGLTPTTWLLATLCVMVGLPYFAAATTGPLLQSWFGATDDPRAKDPYFLYAASNAGSFLGLLCFPFLIEPNFALNGQAEVWTVGYCVLVALVLISGLLALRRRRTPEAPKAEAVPDAPVRWTTRLLWIGLTAAPSSMALGATAAITMDVAAVPLLWIGPLSIYLLTYVLAFWSRCRISSTTAGWFAMVAVLLVLINTVAAIRFPLLWVVGAHLFALATCAYACHRRLYEVRPPVSRLTEFYLLAAVGGALGGVFNALAAPALFNSFLEYPIAIVACLALIAPSASSLKIRWWKHVVLSGAAAGLLLGVAWLLVGPLSWYGSVQIYTAVVAALCVLLALFPAGGNYRFAAAAFAAIVFTHEQRENQRGAVFTGRSFFGVYTVYRDPGRVRIVHGSTLHGEQFLDPRLNELPTSYYHPLGPLGDMFAVVRDGDRPLTVAAVGLGAGTVAAYGIRGDQFTFFEIDPMVRDIAEDKSMFTYLSQAKDRGVSVRIVIGDGRIGIESSDQMYDLIILDAFSSDSIPIHLLTLEAIESYKAKLKPDGILAIHTSNRYFDLGVMVLHAGAKAGLGCDIRQDHARDTEPHKQRRRSTWAALSASPERLKALLNRPEWFTAYLDPKQRIWTDSYSSLFDVPRP